ncbi:ferritin-like domain-containing protein [Rubrivirga sp. IMCC45206]|uniref:ferritin-like domain-containing protein n=1 Tax=Rubrivirga sp. IMCC45206 TaxID=3391614 RepID=UPI00398F97BB
MSTTLSQAGVSPTSRREFFKRAGFGAVAVAAASTLAACDSDDPTDGDVVTLDFSNDFGVLNYAYALEQLEAGFYATVIGASGFTSTFSADEQAILRDLAAHEGIHRDFFEAAIRGANGMPIPDLTPDFDSIDFSSRSNVLAVAQTFEDLGVSAYNGAGKYIESEAYLLLAGKIVSVEARHASVIAGLITPNTIAASGVIDANGLDRALEPSAVLAAAAPFIRDTIRVTNVPTV